MKTLDALQHLTIPPTVWTQISMYFIVGFPKYGNKVVIMVVVDRIYKYAHFVSLQHPFRSYMVAQVFMDNMFKQHGIP